MRSKPLYTSSTTKKSLKIGEEYLFIGQTKKSAKSSGTDVLAHYRM